MRRIKIIAALIFFAIITLGGINATRTFAYPPFLKQSKDLGFEAKDCTFCHEKNTGGKGWNKRGLWLKDQKKERKAPMVDVKWLKSYNPDGNSPDNQKEVQKDSNAEAKPEQKAEVKNEKDNSKESK